MHSEVSKDSAAVPNSSGDSLRLWPGVVIAAVVAGFLFIPGYFYQGTFIQFLAMMVGPAVGLIAFFLWWFLGARAPGSLRLPMIVCFVICAIVAVMLSHSSMKFALYLYAVPSVIAAFTAVLWLVRGGSRIAQKRSGGISIVLSWAFFCLLRLDGLDGHVMPQFAFRWSPTAEERYLAELAALPSSDLAEARPAPLANEANGTEDQTPDVSGNDKPAAMESEWPGFRGRNRDGHVLGTRIETDWASHPPQQRWRRPIGPGWSSFAVFGQRLYTQEQRAGDEVVVCIDLENGGDVWSRPIGGRFYEVIGGAGPRATPTFDAGRVFAVSATGSLLCLDAFSGDTIWQAEMPKDGGDASRDKPDGAEGDEETEQDATNIDDNGLVKTPPWGFSSSPLVVDQQVIVFAGGGASNSLLSYDIATGKLNWAAGNGKHSYSSPHFATLAATPQILMVTDVGLQALSLDGAPLWENLWPTPAYRVVQPSVTRDGEILYGTNNGMGTRKLKVSNPSSWQVEEAWTSRRLKPYFNDFVVHDGHAYGFDNSILVCIDLTTGEQRWKGGRYGTGQLLLLADQGVLLVVTEKSGEAVLVNASPDRHEERSRTKVIDGKTWNHPVLAGNLLIVRNAEEARCWVLEAQAPNN